METTQTYSRQAAEQSTPIGGCRSARGAIRAWGQGDAFEGESEVGLSGGIRIPRSIVARVAAISLGDHGTGVSGALIKSDSIASVGATNVCTFMNGPLALASGDAPDTNGTTDANLTWWVEPNGDGALDDDSELRSFAKDSEYCLHLSEAAFTPSTFSRSHLFPGHVADLRPTGSATSGEIEDFDLGVSGDVLSYGGEMPASSQAAITHAANVVARSDIGGDGLLVNARTSPEAADGMATTAIRREDPLSTLSRLRGKRSLTEWRSSDVALTESLTLGVGPNRDRLPIQHHGFRVTARPRARAVRLQAGERGS